MSDHSSRLDKITPRLSAFFLACALAGGAAAIMSSAARAGGPDAEAVTIDTTFIVKTPPCASTSRRMMHGRAWS